jgi:hypothetical protein
MLRWQPSLGCRMKSQSQCQMTTLTRRKFYEHMMCFAMICHDRRYTCHMIYHRIIYIYISHAMIHTDDINDIWWLLMSPMYSNVTWCVQCKGFPIKVVLRSSLIHVLRIWPAVHWIRLRLRTLGIPMHQGHHLDRPLEPWRSRNLNGTSPKSRQEHSFETDGWIVRGLSLKWRFQTLHQSRRDD